jgi:hypothetical protein
MFETMQVQITPATRAAVNKLGGGGRTRAGRAGPRDRRYCGAVSQAIRAKLAAALTAHPS